MKKTFKLILCLSLATLMTSCSEEDLELTRDFHEQFCLRNEGADMPVIVEGNMESNNLLVVLHGGPGGSSLDHYYRIPKVTDEWEKHFAIVYWEQRGSGVSSGTVDDGASLTIDQFVDDLDQLLTLLTHKYGEVSFFLMGQSFGGALGTHFLISDQAADHNIKGWISMGGADNLGEYTRFVYSHASDFLSQHESAAWDGMRDELNKLDSADYSWEMVSKANAFGDHLMQEVTNAGLANERDTEAVGKAFFFGSYNLVIAILNNDNVNAKIWKSFASKVITEELGRLEVPALYVYGVYDFVAPPIMGREAFDQLGSIDKEFVIMERGTHNPLATNAEASTQLVIDFVASH